MVGHVVPPLVLGFVLGLALTVAAERGARRTGIVAPPTADRWHRRPTPLLGGVAIAVTTAVLVVSVAWPEPRFLILAAAAFGMAVVGLIDDLRSIQPQWKLLAQILLAIGLVQLGFVLRLTNYHVIDVFVTLFWVVGITNAFNLLDNMDGLATTIAIVATAFRLLFFGWDADLAGVRVSAVFIGTLAGFLVRNFPPARIFMGDAGSLFIGFFLAGLPLAASDHAYSRGVAAVLVVPVLLLLIPIFDTAFVTITRVLAGRSPAAGGRDHTSHRLVAIGLTERQALLVLAGMALMSGVLAVVSYSAGPSQTMVLMLLVFLGLVLLGVHLGRVHTVRSVDEQRGGAVLQLLADFQYKRQVLTLSMDVCLIVAAYYAAWVIRFEQDLPGHLARLHETLPVTLLVQLTVLAAFGVYRDVWRYTGVADVIRIVQAATVATMATVVALVFSRGLAELSRTVFVLDWLLLIVLILSSRASFRLLGELLRPTTAAFQRVLIYGAGDAGELVVRELRNNQGLQRAPVGFIDDDREKHRTRIHGLPVFGGPEAVETVIRERGVTEVIISSPKINSSREDFVAGVCRRLDVPVRRASFQLE